MGIVPLLVVFGLISILGGAFAVIDGVQTHGPDSTIQTGAGFSAVAWGVFLIGFAVAIKKLYDIELQLKRSNRHNGIAVDDIRCQGCGRRLTDGDVERGECPSCYRKVEASTKTGAK